MGLIMDKTKFSLYVWVHCWFYHLYVLFSNVPYLRGFGRKKAECHCWAFCNIGPEILVIWIGKLTEKFSLKWTWLNCCTNVYWAQMPHCHKRTICVWLKAVVIAVLSFGIYLPSQFLIFLNTQFFITAIDKVLLMLSMFWEFTFVDVTIFFSSTYWGEEEWVHPAAYNWSIYMHSCIHFSSLKVCLCLMDLQ